MVLNQTQIKCCTDSPTFVINPISNQTQIKCSAGQDFFYQKLVSNQTQIKYNFGRPEAGRRPTKMYPGSRKFALGEKRQKKQTNKQRPAALKNGVDGGPLVHRNDIQYPCIHMSMYTCIHVSKCPCVHVSMYPRIHGTLPKSRKDFCKHK